jgi:hypothetical protein
MNIKSHPTSAFPKIGAPATRAWEAAGYTNLKQLTKVTEAEIAQLHGMGKRLFPDGKRLTLNLIESSALPTGVVYQRFQRIS